MQWAIQTAKPYIIDNCSAYTHQVWSHTCHKWPNSHCETFMCYWWAFCALDTDYNRDKERKNCQTSSQIQAGRWANQLTWNLHQSLLPCAGRMPQTVNLHQKFHPHFDGPLVQEHQEITEYKHLPQTIFRIKILILALQRAFFNTWQTGTKGFVCPTYCPSQWKDCPMFPGESILTRISAFVLPLHLWPPSSGARNQSVHTTWSTNWRRCHAPSCAIVLLSARVPSTNMTQYIRLKAIQVPTSLAALLTRNESAETEQVRTISHHCSKKATEPPQ